MPASEKTVRMYNDVIALLCRNKRALSLGRVTPIELIRTKYTPAKGRVPGEALATKMYHALIGFEVISVRLVADSGLPDHPDAAPLQLVYDLSLNRKALTQDDLGGDSVRAAKARGEFKLGHVLADMRAREQAARKAEMAAEWQAELATLDEDIMLAEMALRRVEGEEYPTENHARAVISRVRSRLEELRLRRDSYIATAKDAH